MTIKLVKYADLKSLLGLDKDSIGDYPALDVIRDGVVYAIEEELGRELEKATRTETKFIGIPSSQMISLPGIPVISVSSLIVTQREIETTYASSDYEITDYGIKLGSKISNSKIVITYSGGISDVPTVINRAALLQTAYEWQSKDQIGAISVSTEGGMVQKPALGLLKEVKRMLRSQKHPLRFI